MLFLSFPLSFSLSLSFSPFLPYLDCVCIFQRCQGIDVLDVFVPEGNSVAPVERADVILNTFHHLRPIMCYVLGDAPAEMTSIIQ